MKNYLFYDEETGEYFFVQEVKCSMSDAEAEMYGYDTY